jgi:hypothetical protein
MKSLTRPLHNIFQRAVLGISLSNLERRTGIKGLKQAYYTALELEANTARDEDRVRDIKKVSAVLGQANNGNEASALYVWGYMHKGCAASNPSFRLNIGSYDFRNGEIVTAMNGVGFETNLTGQFELTSTKYGIHKDGSLFYAKVPSPEMKAFEKYLYDSVAPKRK